MGTRIGTRLRRTRLEQGLSQSSLAEKVKVSQATISNWEKGKGAPNARERARLERILGQFDVPARSFGAASDGDSNDGASPAAEGRLFGDWLRKARETAEMSVFELAEASGVSQMQIYNLEAGRSVNPREWTRRRLEDALKAQVPKDIQDEVAEEQAIQGLGELKDFHPYGNADLPTCAGVYVFYDVSDRPVYVGRSKNIKTRVSAHAYSFWFRYPIVSHAAYVEIKDSELRKQVEQILIKFLKSNAVLNKQYVDRE